MCCPAPPVKGVQPGYADYIRKIYGVNFSLNEIAVPAESPLISMSIEQAEKEFAVRIIALHDGTRMHIAPGALSRQTVIQPNNMLAVMASDYALNRFVETNELDLRPAMHTFAEALTPTRAGMSEIVIPPSSELIGKTPRELTIRSTYGLTVLVVYRDGENLTDISDEPFHSGDTIIAHSPWEDLQALEDDRDFVILTDDYPRREDTRPKKLIHALAFFSLALFLVISPILRLSVALLTGAIGMILSGVISIDEAYDAVSWKTVFLLASLIPLGIAVENSGTANWIAEQTLAFLVDVPEMVLLTVIAILSTFFTLVMSNVGATVLLVPLAISIAIKVGANPAVFAITVALATSNSFIIPTHQVNALLMGPGGYKVIDYLESRRDHDYSVFNSDVGHGQPDLLIIKAQPGIMELNGGHVLISALKSLGVQRIFAVPGESYLAALNALYDHPEIELVTCRQEGGAAMMAEAHGKLSGQPGVCFVTRGPGATNASAGVHIAQQDSTPMILFIGQVARGMSEREAFQEIDYRRFFSPIAKWAGQIDDPARISEFVNRAYHTAVNGRPGPVVLALPEDVLSGAAGRQPLPQFKPNYCGVSPESISAIISTLEQSKRPLVLTGRAGWTARASASLQQFADTNHLPVAAHVPLPGYI